MHPTPIPQTVRWRMAASFQGDRDSQWTGGPARGMLVSRAPDRGSAV